MLIPEIESASQHVLVALLAFQVTSNRRIRSCRTEHSRCGDAHCGAHEAGRRVLSVSCATQLCGDAHHRLTGLSIARCRPIAASNTGRIVVRARTSEKDQ